MSNDTTTSSNSPQLVIMAAGIGSRFGGVKQLARVGPNGESFFDLSILEAQAAGFGEVVMIVRSEIEQDVRDHVASQNHNLPVTYVRQDDLGPARDKPWGTLHAILSAAAAINKPFAVINADDYYGPKSYEISAKSLAAIQPGQATLVAFEVGKTVPPAGPVTRGVCDVSDGSLVGIVETEDCQRESDGTFSAGGQAVPADTAVSMNLWCFHPSVMDGFKSRWEVFLDANRNEAKAEAQLPTVVGELMASGDVSVSVVSSPERWIGITHPDDFELAKKAFADYGN